MHELYVIELVTEWYKDKCSFSYEMKRKKKQNEMKLLEMEEKFFRALRKYLMDFVDFRLFIVIC